MRGRAVRGRTKMEGEGEAPKKAKRLRSPFYCFAVMTRVL